jgi:coproporphyrinogen III oxidase
MEDRRVISEWFKTLQQNIILQLEQTDGKVKFNYDEWNRSEGGGGRTAIAEGGNLIVKGGVNYSAVYGATPQFLIQQDETLIDSQFFASGVSIVIHTQRACLPIIHMNVRYFEAGENVFWFGGGIDLTPHYVNKAEAIYFHTKLKSVCDKFDISYYPRFKRWADDYFYLSHRNETRGIGGIFFDHLNEKEGKSKWALFEFVKAVGELFAPLYCHILQKANTSSINTDEESEWQALRRGRYVEFNLIYDKGTRFGLETNGRTESILMSLPPEAHWRYDYKPQPGSREAETMGYLKKGVNWVEQPA